MLHAERAGEETAGTHSGLEVIHGGDEVIPLGHMCHSGEVSPLTADLGILAIHILTRKGDRIGSQLHSAADAVTDIGRTRLDPLAGPHRVELTTEVGGVERQQGYGANVEGTAVHLAGAEVKGIHPLTIHHRQLVREYPAPEVTRHLETNIPPGGTRVERIHPYAGEVDRRHGPAKAQRIEERSQLVLQPEGRLHLTHPKAQLRSEAVGHIQLLEYSRTIELKEDNRTPLVGDPHRPHKL